MSLIPQGTTLLQKYRVDRLAFERHGVLLYEARDTSNGRTVAVRIARHEVLTDRERFEKFQVEAWGPAAIDFGNLAGLPFIVVTEWEKPPPLPPVRPPPKKTRSIPSPLEHEPIPIIVEEARAPSHAWKWIAAFVIVGLTGAAGWYVGHETSRVARATIVTPQAAR